MAIAKISTKLVDSLSNSLTENLGYANLNVFEGAADRGAAAQKIDTFARAVTFLTTNTYVDTTATYEYSINDVLAEEE